ncbi:hypothetical protein EVAR_88651_1 [Eumeta japonica]|uniref:Uncharacterized protein n=1 Tax=Eumeta variegata TaxID=151549 RepID=A0A4C1YBA3_EUMVA|nr:hypothetical protein EVAR_88651_1 [Eumeta japonica]
MSVVASIPWLKVIGDECCEALSNSGHPSVAEVIGQQECHDECDPDDISRKALNNPPNDYQAVVGAERPVPGAPSERFEALPEDLLSILSSPGAARAAPRLLFLLFPRIVLPPNAE